ncbi:MAG: carbon-phosphorus lyase complex subunit PhnI [Methanosarcina sp.]
MGYVLVKGGSEAIKNAKRLVELIRTQASEPLEISQLKGRLKLAVDQAMGEGGLYAPETAALALEQSEGDIIEASFKIRAYRTTLPRICYSETQDTEDMFVLRRISSAFKDIPGGQILGPTIDYTQRFIDFGQEENKKEAKIKSQNRIKNEKGKIPENEDKSGTSELTNSKLENSKLVNSKLINSRLSDFKLSDFKLPDSKLTVSEKQEENYEFPAFKKIVDLLKEEGVIEVPAGSSLDEEEPYDVTKDPLVIPASRSARLQTLAKGETGAMLMFAYSILRGFGATHPTLAELRVGYIPLRIKHPYTGNIVSVGEILVTECECINSGMGSGTSKNITENKKFAMGYGLVMGKNERKAISMSMLDAAMNTSEPKAPAEDEEFVLYHIDGVDGMGFVEHLKLPHYVSFQSTLDRLRAVQKKTEPESSANE